MPAGVGGCLSGFTIVFCRSDCVLLSSSAADYLNNYDTITLASGDANNTNSLLQTVDPFNPNSNITHIEGDGQRSVAVVQRYRVPTASPRMCFIRPIKPGRTIAWRAASCPSAWHRLARAGSVSNADISRPVRLLPQRWLSHRSDLSDSRAGRAGCAARSAAPMMATRPYFDSSGSSRATRC